MKALILSLLCASLYAPFAAEAREFYESPISLAATYVNADTRQVAVAFTVEMKVRYSDDMAYCKLFSATVPSGVACPGKLYNGNEFRYSILTLSDWQTLLTTFGKKGAMVERTLAIINAGKLSRGRAEAQWASLLQFYNGSRSTLQGGLSIQFDAPDTVVESVHIDQVDYTSAVNIRN